MLTHLRIAHFKRFSELAIPLDSPVVLVGRNGSGKTAALQALALWELGLRTFHARRAAQVDPSRALRPVATPASRPLGVTLRRRDLTQIPLPSASHLWHRTEVRTSRANPSERAQAQRIELTVDGVTGTQRWSCGLEFDYANDDSLMCRPLRLPEFAGAKVASARFSAIPEPATAVRMAYLPPMSGVSVSEPKWELGRVNVLLGEGQTAQVIRNLCLHLFTQKPDRGHWQRLCQRMQTLFAVRLQNPEFIAERGEIVMKYRDPSGTRLDLSAAGQGMLQTLLLLAHAYMNPGAVLLLDEPDAHLEPLRQRQILRALLEVAAEQDSQVIATSHSEILMSEVAGRGAVVHLDLAGSAVARSVLAAAAPDAGWADHLQGAQAGWVLYLPGPADLAILHALALRLGHPAHAALAQPFCHYIGTGPEAASRARRHFQALRSLHPTIGGIALYSQLDPSTTPAPTVPTGPLHAQLLVVRDLDPSRTLPASTVPTGPLHAPTGQRGDLDGRESQDPAPAGGLHEHTWQRGDLDSYYALEEVLLAYAHNERGPIVDAAAPEQELTARPPRRQLQLVAMLSPEQRRRELAMRAALAEVDAALRTLGRLDRQGAPSRTRADFLRPVLRRFTDQLSPAVALREGDYPTLIRLLSPERIAPEIAHQLAAIASAHLLAETQRQQVASAAASAPSAHPAHQVADSRDAANQCPAASAPSAHPAHQAAPCPKVSP